VTRFDEVSADLEAPPLARDRGGHPERRRDHPRMLTTKAPGTGLAPARLAEVTGRRVRVDIPADITLIEGLLE